ncbi:MAG TPA: glycerol-3-phosphate dehydrogenase/oxidase, partial [Steroidobacteraceae bacterium]|nr:glycerol-3-phosphate dehydrogenase/oxidase [Steroidobacteraceae bacterium]
MRTWIPDLAGRTFDLVIVGGGINGAGIAEAASAHGLRVLLAEREDFGSGTTWRSTKLIHGGLRYLEHGELRLVYESLRERRALFRLAPYQVRPLQFVLPVYRGYRHRFTTIWLGLVLYDLLSPGRGMPGHRRRSAAALRRLEPALAAEGLAGGFTYYDGQALYPERLCLESILAARRAGAETLNHCEVTQIELDRGRARGVRLRDTLNGAEALVEAHAIVNAAGPWVDAVLRRTGQRVPRQIGGTRGSHIMVDYAGRGPRHAVYSEAGRDGRPFFIIPWRSWHLIGTTDQRFDGDPSGILPSDDEVAYLVHEANQRLPGLAVQPDDVLYAYAGVRPLPYTSDGTEGAITRRHIVRDHSEDGIAGLYSIIGGKLSTYRSLARQALRYVAAAERFALAEPAAAARHASPAATAPALAALDAELQKHLLALYGARAGAVAALALAGPAQAARLCPHGPDLAAEVTFSAREELAATIGDLLLRRTGAGWNPCLGLDCAAEAGRLLLKAQGRDAGELAALL